MTSRLGPGCIAAVLLCTVLTGCYSYRFSHSSDGHARTTLSSSPHGARVSIAADRHWVAGIVVAVMLAEGVRHYLRRPDGTLVPLDQPREPDKSRRISEQDCTQPIERNGGNLRCR